MDTELKSKLEKLAYQRTKPFCYHCYKTAPTGRCVTCHSDDLMRELPGVGVEYGTDWVIDHIISAELDPVDAEEDAEQSISDCYCSTVDLAGIEYDLVTVLKEVDPIRFDMMKQEFIDDRVNEGDLTEIDGKYYYTDAIEDLADQVKEEAAS